MTFMCHKNMLHAFVVHAADVHTCVCVRRELKSVTYSCIDTCVCACVFTAVSATHSLAYKNSTLSPRTDPAHPPATYRCTLYARNPSWGISKCCCCQWLFYFPLLLLFLCDAFHITHTPRRLRHREHRAKIIISSIHTRTYRQGNGIN